MDREQMIQRLTARSLQEARELGHTSIDPDEHRACVEWMSDAELADLCTLRCAPAPGPRTAQPVPPAGRAPGPYAWLEWHPEHPQPHRPQGGPLHAVGYGQAAALCGAGAGALDPVALGDLDEARGVFCTPCVRHLHHVVRWVDAAGHAAAAHAAAQAAERAR